MPDQTEPHAEMPRYRSHKTVHALKIGDGMFGLHANGDVTLPFADGGFSPITVDKAVVARYFPVPGDYLVIYEDGYRSISPGKVFEDGYTRI